MSLSTIKCPQCGQHRFDFEGSECSHPGEPNPLVDLIADTILHSIDDAAACSHRPDNVRYWLDANSRHLLATRVAAALVEADLACNPPAGPNQQVTEPQGENE